MNIKKSQLLYEEAKKVAPGGVHSNIRWFEPCPLYFSKAKGSKIWDVDDNEYIDCISNYGALILGHGDPDVAEAVREQLDAGLTAGMESKLSVEVAKRIVQMIPYAEMVRFSVTGTGAVMHAIQIARGYTKKERIMKVTGGFHGSYDFVYGSFRNPGQESRIPTPVPVGEGLSECLVEKTLVVPRNDVEKMEKVISQYKDEIAALIIEPVNFNIGCPLPNSDYLKEVRRLTEQNNILLIFDEIITGFRLAPGGASEFFGIAPDLSTYGKAMANGFPLTAVAGKREIMQVVAPTVRRVHYGGTYNGQQTVLAAALAVLDKLKTGEIPKRLSQLTEKLVSGFTSVAKPRGMKVRMQGFAGEFQVYFTDQEVVDFETASTTDQEMYRTFRNQMLENGIYMCTGPFFHHGITIAHTEEDIAKIVKTSEGVLKKMDPVPGRSC